MKTNKEILTKAAKVAHIDIVGWNDGTEPYSSGEGYILANNRIWNPIVDDGDALRLAVTLNLLAYTDLTTRIAMFVSKGKTWQEATRFAIMDMAVELERQAQ